MPISRIYQDQSLTAGQTIVLDEVADHYLRHVLRVKINEPIILFNGTGGEYRAEIVSLTKKSIHVLVQAFTPKEVESNLKLHLVQGLAKGEKMDWIIQKAVELGVSELTPLYTERSQVKLNAEREVKRHAHWQSIIISACEQCGRNRLPRLNPITTFTAWCKQKKNNPVFILSPQGTEKLSSSSLTTADLTVMIGPEGGWSPPELELAKQDGAKTLSMGPRILRTETATIATLSLFQYCLGDLG